MQKKVRWILAPVLVMGFAYLGYRLTTDTPPASVKPGVPGRDPSASSPGRGSPSQPPNSSQTTASVSAASTQATPSSQEPVFPDTSLGQTMKRHLRRMHAYGEDANKKYRESVRELRQNAPEVAKAFHEAYQKLDESRYQARWDITETLRELEDSAAMPALLSIASAPIPDERSKEVHIYSTREEETAIRVTALHGLAFLAETGDKTAEAALVGFVSNPDLSLKRMAIRGYLSSGPNLDQRVEQIKKKLPKHEHYLVTLDSTDITTVPQPPKEELTRSPASQRTNARAQDTHPAEVTTEIKQIHPAAASEDEE